jgi:hypothetical protein
MKHYEQGLDIMTLGEWLNTALGWLLGLVFVVILITIILDKASPNRKPPSVPKPTKTEEERDE